MRRLEALACPTPDDVPFFNAHIRDLGPGSNYRENLENVTSCDREVTKARVEDLSNPRHRVTLTRMFVTGPDLS
jgi:hypothetical protein